jgi:small subunit ribosomal protein S20
MLIFLLQFKNAFGTILIVARKRERYYGCIKEVKRMANIKSAIKRVQTSEKRRAQNAAFKSDLRTSIKTFNAKAENNDVEGAKEAFLVATKKIDKAADKGLIHKNAANRQKSRLQKRLNEVSA